MAQQVRTPTQNVSELWLDFHESCLDLKETYRPVVTSFDPEKKTALYRVHCPYGHQCGQGGNQPYCFEEMAFMKETGDLDKKKVLWHVMSRHPCIAYTFGVHVEEKQSKNKVRSQMASQSGRCHGNRTSQGEVDVGHQANGICTVRDIASALLELEKKHNVSKDAMEDILKFVRMWRPKCERRMIPPSMTILREAMEEPSD